jgi:hypothetical protein
MPWLTLTIAILLACVAGFVGLAVVSTTVGQYALAGIVCVIATYWLTLSSDHRPVH